MLKNNKKRCIKEERADKCEGAGRFLCEKATGILLMLLDMGVVQRGEKGEDGEGVHTKNTHLLSLPFSLSPCFVSTSSFSLSLSHCSEHPPSSQAPSYTRSGLLSIKWWIHDQYHTSSAQAHTGTLQVKQDFDHFSLGTLENDNTPELFCLLSATVWFASH